MQALQTAMRVLDADALPGQPELEAAAEAVTCILNNKWPMSGSTGQWANAKKLLRDAQTAIE
eukprot:3305723-Pyramimonas_sp.AAC.1